MCEKCSETVQETTLPLSPSLLLSLCARSASPSPAHPHSPTLIHPHLPTHTHTHTRARTHAHVHTHTHTHTPTHTHTHTCDVVESCSRQTSSRTGAQSSTTWSTRACDDPHLPHCSHNRCSHCSHRHRRPAPLHNHCNLASLQRLHRVHQIRIPRRWRATYFFPREPRSTRHTRVSARGSTPHIRDQSTARRAASLPRCGQRFASWQQHRLSNCVCHYRLGLTPTTTSGRQLCVGPERLQGRDHGAIVVRASSHGRTRRTFRGWHSHSRASGCVRVRACVWKCRASERAACVSGTRLCTACQKAEVVWAYSATCASSIPHVAVRAVRLTTARVCGGGASGNVGGACTCIRDEFGTCVWGCTLNHT
jgi:hypothetical protein